MIVVRSISEIKKIRQSLDPNLTIGFVPTMGNLHIGHQSLLGRAIQDNDISLLSIYVNPTQFNDPKDLQNYPSTLEADLNLAQSLNVNYVFMPNQQEIYADNYRYRICEHDFSQRLEGQQRPGHFDGVLTIVMKLFSLIKPHRAYFGEKDYQQLALIKGMVEAFFLDLEIVACQTVRQPDGLPYSSRNNLLSQEQRTLAKEFPAELLSGNDPKLIKSNLEQKGFKVDYIEKYLDRLFGAVRVGNIRLIDNYKT